jgi:hypothetical protein
VAPPHRARRPAPPPRPSPPRAPPAVTGQHAGEEEIDRLIEAGEGESVFQSAILEQGRGYVLDTLAEIRERREAVTGLERSLQELHQIFLDMAVLVEAQGQMIDNIEAQVRGGWGLREGFFWCGARGAEARSRGVGRADRVSPRGVPRPLHAAWRARPFAPPTHRAPRPRPPMVPTPPPPRPPPPAPPSPPPSPPPPFPPRTHPTNQPAEPRWPSRWRW